jgi:hypothetical protein
MSSIGIVNGDAASYTLPTSAMQFKAQQTFLTTRKSSTFESALQENRSREISHYPWLRIQCQKECTNYAIFESLALFVLAGGSLYVWTNSTARFFFKFRSVANNYAGYVRIA